MTHLYRSLNVHLWLVAAFGAASACSSNHHAGATAGTTVDAAIAGASAGASASAGTGGSKTAGAGGSAGHTSDAGRADADSGTTKDTKDGAARKPGAPDPSDHRPFVGGCISSLPRLERVPGRVYLDFQGQATDVIKFLNANGFNMARMFVAYGDPAQHGAVDNSNVDRRESNFQLDWAGIDWQVELSKRVRAEGMRVALTIQFGQDKPVADNWHEFIPDAWLGLSYAQTVTKIAQSTRERDQPADAMSDVATGIYSVWPKSAGYFKRVILSVRDEIKRAGFDPDLTRFSVHTTTNPFRVRSTFDRIFKNPHDDAESVYYDGSGKAQGVLTAVPQELRAVRLRDLVDIIGFSVYPPLPTGGDQAAFDTAFAQFTSDLAYMAPDIEKYGRQTSAA